jgi:hypothetical protein
VLLRKGGWLYSSFGTTCASCSDSASSLLLFSSLLLLDKASSLSLCKGSAATEAIAGGWLLATSFSYTLSSIFLLVINAFGTAGFLIVSVDAHLLPAVLIMTSSSLPLSASELLLLGSSSSIAGFRPEEKIVKRLAGVGGTEDRTADP